MSLSQESFLPSEYRSKQQFLASLPPWRRLLANLNWHPTIDLKVRRYAIEQRLLQMRNEDERMRNEDERRQQEDERLRKLDAKFAELDARLSAIVSSSSTSSSQPPVTLDNPEM